MVRFALMSFALILVGCGEAAVSPPSDTQPGKQGGVAIATSTGEPDAPHTSTEWQIWAYSTASPTFISSNATAADGEMNVLREGTNGWMCLPPTHEACQIQRTDGRTLTRLCPYVPMKRA